MRLCSVVASVLVGCGGGGHHPGDAIVVGDGPCADCTRELPLAGVALATSTTLFTIRPKLCSSVDRNCFEVAAWDKQTSTLATRCVGDAVAGDDQGIAVQAQLAYGTPPWGPAVYACTTGPEQIMNWAVVPSRMPFLVTAGGGHAFIADSGNIVECPLAPCPSPTVLAPGGQQPAGADANGLYLCGNTITVIPLAGAPTAIFTSSEPVVACAYSADRIWFATATKISSCPKSTSPCTPKVATTGAFSIDGLHADTTNVYWLDHGNVMSCEVDGCTLQTKRTTCDVASPAPDKLPLFNGDAANLYCAERNGKTLQIPK